MDLVEHASELSRSQHVVGEERVIFAGDTQIEATLSAPLRPRGVVVILHASSTGRFEPRNLFAAQVLDQGDLATVQVDLLTPAEEATWSAIRDTAAAHELLVARSMGAVRWLEKEPMTAGLPIGLFTSTSEALAAVVVAMREPRVVALVSQGGYPNCPDELPSNLQTPTLLIIGHEEQARAADLAAAFFARRFVNQWASGTGPGA